MANNSSKFRNSAPKRKHRRNRLTTVLAVVAVLSAVLTASLAWGAMAKYTHQSNREGLVRAKEFYFTSDYLATNNPEYTLNPGNAETASVTFELRNYDGLLVSELDVNYTITVTDNDSENDATVTIGGDGKITTGETKEVVTLSNLRLGMSYTVEVKGSNGYEKTLYATFTVKKPNEGIFYNTKKVGDYVLVTVWTENATASDIVVTVPTNFIPDATDVALSGWTTGAGSVAMENLDAYESRSYRFFQNGGNIDAIVVTAGGNAVTKVAELN